MENTVCSAASQERDNTRVTLLIGK